MGESRDETGPSLLDDDLVTGGSDFRALNQLDIAVAGRGHLGGLNQFDVGVTGRSYFADFNNLHSVSPFHIPKTTDNDYLDAATPRLVGENFLRLSIISAIARLVPNPPQLTASPITIQSPTV